MLAGHDENTGFSLSVTVTVNEHVLTFPLASVAVNVTVVTPTGKAAPEGKPAVWVTIVPGQLSFATGAGHDTTALHTPELLILVMLDGHDANTGSWLSITVTVNEHTDVFPIASVAVYEILVTPIGNEDPLAGPAVCVMVTAPGQLSLAVGAGHVTVALHAPGVLLTTMLAGQLVNPGPAASVTLTVNAHTLLFP
jgi:hypothetical protein